MGSGGGGWSSGGGGGFSGFSGGGGSFGGAAPVPAGKAMRTKEFLSKLEHDQIVQAIRDAESNTSGEIRVYIQRGKLDVDPLIAAQKKFHRLGMGQNTGAQCRAHFRCAPRPQVRRRWR